MQTPFFTSKESKLFSSLPLHFVLSNRHFGISNAPYQSLNLAYHVRDNESSVSHNRNHIMQTYYPNKTLLYCNQIHSNIIFTMQSGTNPQNINFGGINQNINPTDMNPQNINFATPHIYNNGKSTPQQSVPIALDLSEVLVGNGDGIICQRKEFVAMSMVADCNPILVYAPSCNVFALLHAGRAGVCDMILTHALLLLTRNYHAPKSDMRIFIGASIRSCCYEIGRDLATQITKNHGAQYLHERDGIIRLDMIGMLLDEAKSFGIAQSQIEIHESCSCCDRDYFSYRREGETGRFGLFASLCS